jgi:hypothetical protein
MIAATTTFEPAPDIHNNGTAAQHGPIRCPKVMLQFGVEFNAGSIAATDFSSGRLVKIAISDSGRHALHVTVARVEIVQTRVFSKAMSNIRVGKVERRRWHHSFSIRLSLNRARC